MMSLKKILPRLRVVARALPTDKSRLVRIAQELNMVVGMTGDGVNDSPALKKSRCRLCDGQRNGGCKRGRRHHNA